MKKILILLGSLSPTLAIAANLNDVGKATISPNYAKPMWDDICSILPYCGKGDQGVQIATGIVSKVILWTIGPAAVLVILYAAIRMVTSAGNDETVRKSMKEIILYALLGLILAVLADTIISFIYNLVAGIVSA